MAPVTAFPFPSHLKPTSTSTPTSKPKPKPRQTSPSPAPKSPESTTQEPRTNTTSVDTAPSSPNSASCVTITTTAPAEPTPPESTLTKLSKLYAPLARTEQTHLLQLAHFIHLHASSLHLTPYDLLDPVEESILNRSGKAYDALLKVLPRQRSTEPPALETLLTLAESLPTPELRDNYHKPFPSSSAKTGANPHEIRACARPTRVQDSRNDQYVWVRGVYNMSPRIARNDVLLKQPLKHAEKLRVRGGRKDVFVSGWIASRVETAERVERGVRVEGEKKEREERERMRRVEIGRVERMEREIRKKEERDRWEREREEREKEGVGVMTRRRRSVCYAESEEEEEEGVDGEEFVCDELLDGSDHDESESEGEDEEEVSDESEREEARVVGRVRVSVSDRTRRAERRARAVKHSSEDEDDSEDDSEGESGGAVRRSKRLRRTKA